MDIGTTILVTIFHQSTAETGTENTSHDATRSKQSIQANVYCCSCRNRNRVSTSSCLNCNKFNISRRWIDIIGSTLSLSSVVVPIWDQLYWRNMSFKWRIGCRDGFVEAIFIIRD